MKERKIVSTPGKPLEDLELREKIVEEANTSMLSAEVGRYVKVLEEDNEELYREVLKRDADLSLEKDQKLGLYELLERRPKDRRLAQIMCDWMNIHQKTGDEGWKICLCELCVETKAQMNRLGDPIVHTTAGWKCVQDNPEFKTRDVAQEFCDNTPKIGPRTVDAEVYKP